MDKKKIIIVVVVFLLLGTMIYSFASGPSNPEEQPSGGGEQTEQPEEKPDDDEETPGDQDDDSDEEQPGEDDQTGTDDDSKPVIGGETDTTNYLAIAEQAVAAAEESLTQADLDAAKEAIQNVIDNVENADVSDLISKVENVENIIDFETLFKELEDKTNSATNKEELDAARNYNTTNDLTTQLDSILNELVENATKTSLEERYEVVLAKLNDTDKPRVEGIQNGEFTKGPVSLTITDDSSFKATLSKNGVEVGPYVTGDEIEEDGKYTLTLVDSSFNENVIEFVINNTDPVIALPTLKENIFTNDGTINVTDDIEFEVVITLDGETKDTITATVQTDGTYLATLDLSQYGKGKYTITATDKAGNTVTSATFDFDATGALVTNIDELNAALSDNTIETIYLNNDITDLTSRVVVNRAVTINGNNHKLTFTDAINGATYGERQGVVVSANDVVINDLTIEMDAVEGDDTWTGTYAIQVFSGSATLNNITTTGADGGIFANNSTITLTGTIDVSGNEFGGIEVSNGNPVLNATEATLVNTTEEFKKPTIWTDKTPNAVVNVKDMFENKYVKDEQIQYYLDEEYTKIANVSTIDELNAALSDNTIETIYLNNDITDLTSRVVVNRAVTINGNNHKLTFTDAINGATYGERQGVVVSANDVVINDLTIEMDAVEGDDTWTGTYAIQVFSGSATLNNITTTGADGGIFSNRSTVTLTGTIDVSGNEFGGIEVSNGTSTLNATEATIVNTTEAFRKPTIWTDQTPDAVVNVEGFTSNNTIKNGQVQYYLNENNIENSEITTNVNDIYTSTDLNQPTSITPNASATITVYKSYTNIRFKVENIITPDGANVKVWAQDTDGNIWDMITAGWGPEAGFPVEAGYSATTPFQIVVDKAGSYSADIVLYDVTANEELSRQTIAFEANMLVTNETELSESLADSTIDTIYLPADFTSTTTALDINRPVTIVGNGATLSNQVTISGDDVVLKDVILTDDLTVTGENAILDEVTISGVTSTGTGNGSGHTVVKVDTTGDFTMTNSTIDNASSTGSFYNALNIKATGVVTIEDNNFTNMNNVYNVIEFSQSVATANGTTIKGNKFDGANKNNIISMFLFEEGTVINIEDNEFAFSGNALRVSNYNNVNDVTFNISNNKYNDTLSGAYAGFMLFQEVKNESFSGITVNVNNLIGPSGEKVTADSTGKDVFCYYFFDNVTNTGEATINFLD